MDVSFGHASRLLSHFARVPPCLFGSLIINPSLANVLSTLVLVYGMNEALNITSISIFRDIPDLPKSAVGSSSFPFSIIGGGVEMVLHNIVVVSLVFSSLHAPIIEDKGVELIESPFVFFL